MREGVQSFFKAVGEGACLALCIIKTSEELSGASFDDGAVVQLLEYGVDRGFVFYAWENPGDPRNFEVSDVAGFLSSLVHREVSVRYVSDPLVIQNFQPGEGEYVIRRYVKVDSKGRASYCFRCPSWDPMAGMVSGPAGTVDRLTVFRVG
jgi:hypothetical protein